MPKYPDYSDYPDPFPALPRESYLSYKKRYNLAHGNAVECVIERASDGVLMFYDRQFKTLFPEDIAQGKFHTEFPSRKQACTARWHHTMQSGIPMSHNQWKIVPVSLLG